MPTRIQTIETLLLCLYYFSDENRPLPWSYAREGSYRTDDAIVGVYSYVLGILLSGHP
jgi:hypothetical protein